ncbi:hypothetical protein HOLleu_20643 [Holothuria leucospilota]|uniref:SEA domain-containing protein n=1 Tax=Holothuria leucospilota TaxID=206669 RepID=A0A9Q1C033_HOLLE|nr:hypothetical protein HOLleu_20643 [Holothuria leucospilota]
MAEISSSVTVSGIMWQMIVLFVAVYLDVTVGGALPSTESSEVTELQTTIIELSEEGVSPSSQPPVSSSRPPSSQGEDNFRIRFTILDYKWANTSKKLEDKVLDQVSFALKERLPDFAGAEFDAFRKSKEDSSLTADMEIYLNEKLSGASRAAAYDILLDLVAVRGAFGSLRVGGLKVENDIGQMNAFTYCNITEKSCPDGVHCVGNGSSCTASCKMNEAYCLNGGTCRDEDVYITCHYTQRNSAHAQQHTSCPFHFSADTARVAVIAVAVVIFLLILLILLFCLVRKCQPCTKPSRELYGVENVVALHSIRDEAGPVGGVAIQTDDSFLLNLSYANGVPPKAGYSHKIMQTNESFLLARSQNPKVAQVKAQTHLSQSQNGSPTTSENSNGSREPKPSPQGGTSSTQPEDNSKVNAEGTQTGGSLPRKIIKV